MTQEQFCERVCAVYGDEYEVLGEFCDWDDRVMVRHTICNTQFEMVPKHFVQKHGTCPLCRKNKRGENFICALNDKWPGGFELVGEYVNRESNVVVRHIQCGRELHNRASTFLSLGCSFCFGRKTDSDKFVEKLNKKYGGQYKVLGEYQAGNVPIKVFHQLCQGEFEASPYRLITGKKTGCPICRRIGNRKHTIDELRTEFRQRGLELISTEYINNDTPLDFICFKHKEAGIQHAVLRALPQDGCALCGRERTGLKVRLSEEEYRSSVENLGYEFVKVEYVDNHARVDFICPIHRELGIQSRSATCAREGNMTCCACRESSGERDIRQYCELHNITYESQKRFSDLLGTGGKHLSYDFFLPQYNMLVEFQGAQHERPVEFFGKDKAQELFEKQQEHDRRKKEYANLNGYRFLEISYREQNQIVSLLDQALNLTEVY